MKDQPKIVELPNNGFAPSNSDIARHLREQADWMEERDSAEVSTVILVIEAVNGRLHRQVAGRPCDMARMVGLLTMAAAQASTIPLVDE